MLAILFLAKGSYRHISHRCLELDERVCAVVAVCRQGLAIGAEISVVAHCTLVTVAKNIVALVFAQWTIAVDAIMTLCSHRRVRNGLVEWDKSMTRVVTVSKFDAAGAVIPIWAIQAFVANTNNILRAVSRLWWR